MQDTAYTGSSVRWELPLIFKVITGHVTGTEMPGQMGGEKRPSEGLENPSCAELCVYQVVLCVYLDKGWITTTGKDVS